MNTLRHRLLIAVVLGALATACTKKQDEPAPAVATPEVPAAEEKVLNLFIWNDYLAEDTAANFEKQTGIEVTVSNYGSNEELEAKLAPGHSGYDIVVPSAAFLERQLKVGLYLVLDKTRLPHLKSMDPYIQKRLALHDPGNAHAVLHVWGTAGIGYSKDANSQKPEDLAAATAALMRLRPFVRYVDTQRMITDLANGEVCLVVGYNGDILQAASRAQENKTGQKIAYAIPKEGTIMWFDSYAIPKDAPHPGNAHLFINYMLQPQVIAAVTNFVRYPNGNSAARQFIDKEVLEDPGIYPPPEVVAKLVPDLADTEETTRVMTRGWQQFTTGH